MENSLLKKLHIKQGFKVIIGIPPEQGAGILGDTSAISLERPEADDPDALLLFVKNTYCKTGCDENQQIAESN